MQERLEDTVAQTEFDAPIESTEQVERPTDMDDMFINF